MRTEEQGHGLAVPGFSSNSWTSRRVAISSLAAASALAAQRVHAFFESPAQLAILKISATLPVIEKTLKDVTEWRRRRRKGVAIDPDDDAFLFRFARSELLPLNEMLAKATPTFGPPFEKLAEDFRVHQLGLEDAARKRDVELEVDELTAIVESIKAMDAIALDAKYTVRTQADKLNAYDATAGFVYPKWLFRK